MSKKIIILYAILSVVIVSTVFAADIKPAGDAKSSAGIKTSGIIFINYPYDITDLGKDKGFNKIDIERTYLTFESDISDKAKIKVVTDIYQNSKAVSFKAEDGSKIDNTDAKEIKVSSYYDGWAVRLKNAYIDLNLIPMTTVRVGMIGTPWIPTVEKAWGYRFVKPVLTDVEKLFSSADLGVGAIVKLPEGYGEVMVTVVNGVGYSKPEDNKYKDIIPRITVTPLPKNKILKGLSLSGYYYLGKQVTGDRNDLDRNRLGALLSFSYDFLNIGGEFDTATDQKLKGTDIEDISGTGFSAFGEVKLAKVSPQLKNLGIIARFDSWDPNTDKEDDAHTALVAGLVCAVTKNVRTVIGLQQTTYQSDLKTMGIVKTDTTDKTARQLICQLEVKY